MTMSTPEADLIPFQSVQLRGERLLVLAPHPDDEVIGCGGLLCHHADEGRAVRVVIATDGSAAESDLPQLAAVREKESLAGLRHLGVDDVVFLRHPDRGLGAAPKLQDDLRNAITSFRPDLIACTHPNEIHPDHRALATALITLLQSDRDLAASLAMVRIAFYEVSAPLRPNILVDVTAVADRKTAAIREHHSQLQSRDYLAYTNGLNQYRAMTLDRNSTRAEAYWVIAAAELQVIPESELTRQIAGIPAVEHIEEILPVTVVIRTKDRPQLLREAVDSVRRGAYPSKIIVVNDGGHSPGDLLSGQSQVTLIDHERTRGRSEAMNTGVRSATTPFVTFLDDDDVYYPEHLSILTRAAQHSSHRAYYTDAVSVFLEMGDDGAYLARKRLRMYAQDFDRNLLLFDNYIPLTTLLLRRDDFLSVEGFDPAFDLFEDWDFLIRLSKTGSFLRVPRITCEVRHFAGSESIILGAPEGSEVFRSAKLKVWKKHSKSLGPDQIADALESYKRRVHSTEHQWREAEGRTDHLGLDVERLEREKRLLISEIEKEHFEGVAAADKGREFEIRLAASNQQIAARTAELENLRHDLREITAVQVPELTRDRDLIRAALTITERSAAEQGQTIASLYAEITRLNGLLDTIYKSRTWKLHRLMEAARGKSG